MKIIITGLLILVLLTAACFGSACYVTGAVQDTEALLERAMSVNIHTDTAALSLVRSATKQWNECAPVFGTLLRHDEVDDVIAEFARLEYYAKTKDHEEFLSTCAALLAKLGHIRDMEWPTLQNIL